MMNCPICKSAGSLRRGRAEDGRHPRYWVGCTRCWSYFSVPEHLYFQLYAQRGHRTKERTA